ncbi:phospholipase-like protein [Tanacetum coccineum]
MERYDQAFKCTCEKGDVVLRTSRKPYSYGKQYYACPCSKPETQDRGCGYFMWMDDLRLRINSSSGPSTPPSSYPGPLTRSSYSSGPSGSVLNLGKAEMDRHPENHTLESVAILYELYNDMGKFGLE